MHKFELDEMMREGIHTEEELMYDVRRALMGR